MLLSLRNITVPGINTSEIKRQSISVFSSVRCVSCRTCRQILDMYSSDNLVWFSAVFGSWQLSLDPVIWRLRVWLPKYFLHLLYPEGGLKETLCHSLSWPVMWVISRPSAASSRFTISDPSQNLRIFKTNSTGRLKNTNAISLFPQPLAMAVSIWLAYIIIIYTYHSSLMHFSL